MKKTLMLLSVACLTAGVANAQSLLSNGNFSTDADANGSPDGWGSWTAGGGVGWKSDAMSTDGYYVNVWGGTWGNQAGWYQSVSAAAGISYELKVDSSTEGWWNPEGKIGLVFKDASNNVLANNELVVANYANSLPWTTYTLTSLAPADTTQVTVDLKFFGGGAVLFDNASLTVVPEPGIAGLFALGSAFLAVRARRSR